MATPSQQLIAQIDALRVPHGQLALWALGQVGFVIKGDETIAYIDPYLSDSISDTGGPPRRFPSPLAAADASHAQVVFATHEHMDHADAATLGPLMAAASGAVLITSPQGRDVATGAGVAADRIVTPALGVAHDIGGLTYTAIPAAHYAFEVDDTGRSRFMGFLIQCNGVTLYHAGDTIIIPELVDALQGTPIDIAALPINGRDAYRDRQQTVGNLWPGEAVELAQELGAKVLLATHNDLFAANRVNPGMLWDELDRRAPFQRCHILQPGELYLYAG